MSSNFLSPINFKFKLPITPNTNYRVQSIRLPGLNLGTAEIKTPFVTLNNPGNISHDTFSIKFLIGENMEDYLEIFNWMVGLGHPEDLDQYDFKKSDASVHILNFSKSANMRFDFKDVYPISLSSIDLNSALIDTTTIDCVATFKFDTYRIIRENVNLD